MAIADLAKHFQSKGKDESIFRELRNLRGKFAAFYPFLSNLYLRFYWDEKRNKIGSYKVTEKRFPELKTFYVDCFETFCRVSAIAAGIEGITYQSALGVPLAKRVMTLDEYETANNGTKPDLIKHLKIADLFVPFIDNKLRNGIRHHAAHYESNSDTVEYTVENAKGIQNLSMPYTVFCEKIRTHEPKIKDVTVGESLIGMISQWQTGHSLKQKREFAELEAELGELFSADDFRIEVGRGSGNLQLRIDGKFFGIDDLGDGVAHFIFALSNALFQKPAYVLIDEPEIGLHPRLIAFPN